MTDTPDPDDLLNLDNMRRAPTFDPGIESVPTGVSVRKPAKEEWFRVHPEPEYSIETDMLEHTVEGERTLYIVAAAVISSLRLSGVKFTVKRFRIFTCITRRSSYFLWPQQVPGDPGTPGRSWHVSAFTCADAAKKGWVSMSGDKAGSSYVLSKPLGQIPDPEWADYSFQMLIRLGFRDRTINDDEHPVIKDLKGEE
jgi:hypothetical protein